MPFIESFEEFRQRQSCEFIVTNSRYLFANGAQSNGQTYHGDPPTDPQALLSLRLEYLTAMLKREEGRFNRTQSYIISQGEIHAANAGPPVDPQAFVELEMFQKNVLGLREQLRANRAELAEQRGPSLHQEHQRRLAEQQRAGREAIARAVSIQI